MRGSKSCYAVLVLIMGIRLGVRGMFLGGYTGIFGGTYGILYVWVGGGGTLAYSKAMATSLTAAQVGVPRL